MPKTPKVPRPPVVDDETRGLTAHEMQSLMRSDDRASGFATKGHIDLRELDADPSHAVTARPRAPTLPTDAKEYESRSEETSASSMWFGVVALVAVAAVVAYFVLSSSSGTEEADAQPQAGVEVGESTVEVEQPAHEPEHPVDTEGSAEALVVDEASAETKAPDKAVTKTTPEPTAASNSHASESRPVNKAKSASDDEEHSTTDETEGVDTADIARRAAAVSGEQAAEDDTVTKTAGENVGGAVDEALAEKPKAAKSIDELLDTATGTSDEFEEKKPEPPPPSGDAPSKADVSKVMGQLMPGFRSCAGAQVGVATALVAVKSTGKVVSARVSGAPFGGTRQGQCMEDVIKRRAEFVPFKKTRFEFRYPIHIQP